MAWGPVLSLSILDHKHNVGRAQAKTTDDVANTNLSHKMADVQFRRMPGKNYPGFGIFAKKHYFLLLFIIIYGDKKIELIVFRSPISKTRDRCAKTLLINIY